MLSQKKFLPIGFYFQPSEREIVQHYLQPQGDIDKKIWMLDVDIFESDPEILAKCHPAVYPENSWYVYANNTRKYPLGTVTHRQTSVGYWKSTGLAKNLRIGEHDVEIRCLVYYLGRAPKSKRTAWKAKCYRTVKFGPYVAKIRYDSDSVDPVPATSNLIAEPKPQAVPQRLSSHREISPDDTHLDSFDESFLQDCLWPEEE